MERSFFPDPIFGWSFIALLSVIGTIAAAIDLRRMQVPKWVTLGCLVAGVALTIVRAMWLGSRDEGVFVLEPNGIWTGALDGVLFSLAGFGLGFATFFVLWVMGTCGGGDVKFFAALGAWIGPVLTIFVLGVSVVVVIVLMIFKFLTGGLSPSAIRRTMKQRPKLEAGGGNVRKKDRLRLTFSLPLAVSTLLVLLWFCRFDLGLASRPAPDAQKERAHASEVYIA